MLMIVVTRTQTILVPAVLPLCVGISTTASAFALLAPALIADLAPRLGVQIVTEARSRMRSRCDHAIPDAIMGS